MKKLLLNLFVVALLGGFFFACEKEAVNEDDQNEKNLKTAKSSKTSYIVVMNDLDVEPELSGLVGYDRRQEAMEALSTKVLKRAGVVDGELTHFYGHTIKGFAVKIPPGQLKKLQDDPAVKYVEKDQIVSLGKPESGDVSATAAQETPYGIARVGGGATYTGSGKAWVIDSGIDFDHPDLNVEPALGANFTRAKSADDDNGHGSHVAGTIAAINNNIGVVGVAAGATVIPVKVLDRRGSGSYSGVIAGVDFVAANASDGDVANMSLGGPASDALDAAVVSASNSCKFILAAGNERDDANNYSPARIEHTNVYTVSGCDKEDNWYYWSNYANPPVDYCEPGVSVLSTYKNGGYATASGTSMAAPHLAGILLWGDVGTDGRRVNGDMDGSDGDFIGIVSGNLPNQAPNANFDFTTSDLTASFNDLSSDSDGSIVSWSWNFGDGGTSTLENPDHTYTAEGTYTVTLTVTDNENATGSASKDVTVSVVVPGDIVLTATGNKVKGTKNVSLSWTVTSGLVDIYRDGNIIDTVSGNSFSESLGKGGGTYVYKVCEAGTSKCSNNATVIF